MRIRSLHHKLDLVLTMCVMTSLVAGGAVAEVDPESTGLNPAWRKALVHSAFGFAWPDGASTEELIAVQEQVAKHTRDLEELVPDSGAYFNEVSINASYVPPPRWQPRLI